jgi:hypothetical protein
MNFKVKVKLNNNQEIEANFDGADLQDSILQANALLAFDGKCGLCGNNDLTLQTRPVSGGNFYTEFICRKCKAKAVFGQYKASKTFYLKNWEPGFNQQ